MNAERNGPDAEPILHSGFDKKRQTAQRDLKNSPPPARGKFGLFDVDVSADKDYKCKLSLGKIMSVNDDGQMKIGWYVYKGHTHTHTHTHTHMMRALSKQH